MACRSAILIDNFLEQSKFDTISAKVAASSEYNTTTVKILEMLYLKKHMVLSLNG